VLDIDIFLLHNKLRYFRLRWEKEGNYDRGKKKEKKKTKKMEGLRNMAEIKQTKGRIKATRSSTDTSF